MNDGITNGKVRSICSWSYFKEALSTSSSSCFEGDEEQRMHRHHTKRHNTSAFLDLDSKIGTTLTDHKANYKP